MKTRRKGKKVDMRDSTEEFEPLFDYSRTQPVNVVCFDDEDDSDTSAPLAKRSRTAKPIVERTGSKSNEVEVVKVVKVVEDEDWLPPPPSVTTKEQHQSVEDSTIKALRLKKQELLFFANSADDLLREEEESAAEKVDKSLDSSLEAVANDHPKPQMERPKIVISIQDKDGQKQFRIYTDDKFERVFKMYADKAKLDLSSLVFCFDGDKINPSVTPAGLGMEDDDMIEVHLKKS